MMDVKEISSKKVSLSVIFVLVIVVVFAIVTISALAANARLEKEVKKVAALNSKVAELNSEATYLKSKNAEQVKTIGFLQDSLDAAKREADALKNSNNNLESRLNAALEALQNNPQASEAGNAPVTQ